MEDLEKDCKELQKEYDRISGKGKLTPEDEKQLGLIADCLERMEDVIANKTC